MNELSCYCFMDAGRRYETPGSETKRFIIFDTASGMYISIFMFVSLARQSPQGQFAMAQVKAVHTVIFTALLSHTLRGRHHFHSEQ